MQEPSQHPMSIHDTQSPRSASTVDLRYIRHTYAGWYPGWWMMAAFLCAVTIVCGMIIWDQLLCPPVVVSQNAALICGLSNSAYLVQIILIWLLFLFFWLIAFIFGVQAIEGSQCQRSGLKRCIRSLTAFKPLHRALLWQGAIASIFLNIMWWQDTLPAIPFALLCICVFVGHCSLFYSITPRQRRLTLIAYGFLSALLLSLEILLKRNFQLHFQDGWPLLVIQGLLVLAGIIAIFWRSQDGRQSSVPTSHPTYDGRLLSPLHILASLWPFNHLLPSHILVAPEDALDVQQQGGSDEG